MSIYAGKAVKGFYIHALAPYGHWFSPMKPIWFRNCSLVSWAPSSLLFRVKVLAKALHAKAATAKKVINLFILVYFAAQKQPGPIPTA